jgi:hypothetical protein
MNRTLIKLLIMMALEAVRDFIEKFFDASDEDEKEESTDE